MKEKFKRIKEQTKSLNQKNFADSDFSTDIFTCLTINNYY